MEYKQPAIAEELKRRIAGGTYVDRLPTSLELAAEFGVNVKTVNKAVARLVGEGLLERRRHSGTRIASGVPSGRDDRLIEVIFEGFTTLFTHPFWGEIWSGMVEKLAGAGFRPVLNMLEADRDTGLLKLDGFSMIRSAGKIVLGIVEKRLLDQVAGAGVPFLAAGDPIVDTAVPQVSLDFRTGIRDAVDFLAERGCRRIAFVGQTRSYIDSGVLQKYEAYRCAVQKYVQLDPSLIQHVRPLAGNGAEALAAILDRARPDALIAACDHQLPEMFRLLAERDCRFPVIGCDGLNLAELPPDRHVVVAPRRRCGEVAATQLIAAIGCRGKPRSAQLSAVFR